MNYRKGSEVCAMKGKIRSVNQDSDCSDSDSDVASVKTLNAFVNGVASKKDKPIYGEMHIRSNPVRRQVDCGDCGTTVSIIPKGHISDTQLKPSKISLRVWNKEKMNALGTCKLSLQNPKTSQKYMVNFDVFSRKSSSPCQVPNQLRRWNISQSITISLKVSVEWLKTSTIPYKLFLMCSVNILALCLLCETSLKAWCRTNSLPTKRLPIDYYGIKLKTNLTG